MTSAASSASAAAAASSASASDSHLRQTPHALLLPFPETGHIHPLMQLAISLSTHGCLITFVNTLHNHSRIIQSNASHLPSDAGLPIQLVAIPDGLAETHDRDTDISNMFEIIYKNAVSSLAPLISDLNRSGPPITCIISDVCAAGTLDVAKQFGIPRVAFWPPAVSTYILNCHAIVGISNGSLPAKGVVESNETVVQFPGLPPLPGLQLPWIAGTREQAEIIFEGMKRNLETLHESEWILCNSVEELEAAMVETIPEGFPTMRTVGPLFLLNRQAMEGDEATERTQIKTWLWEEEEVCMEWLDAQEERSVLYVSIGSIVTMRGEQMREMAHALEDCGASVLWSLRQATTVEEDDNERAWTEELVEKLRQSYNGVHKSSKMMIARWVPQVSVLSHPSIAGFLTHTGWNSTIEAMALGVPMLCWPHLVDQFLNTLLLITHWRVGYPLLPPTEAASVDAQTRNGPPLLDRFTMATRIAHFMVIARDASPDSILSNALKLRQTILRAVSKGGSSHDNMSRFLDWIKATGKIPTPEM